MQKNKKMHSIVVLVMFIFVVEVMGGLSGWFAGDIKTIYNNLILPPLAPPDYLFGIVWPLLYALIASAAYLIYRQSTTNMNKASAWFFYVAQLVLNFVWSIVFFKGHYWIGVVIILVLDVMVLICIERFYRLNRLASLLLVPYLMWIIFATYLTVMVAVFN